jgi:hypothetical protein
MSLNQRVPGSSPSAPTIANQLAAKRLFYVLDTDFSREQSGVAPFWHCANPPRGGHKSAPISQLFSRPASFAAIGKSISFCPAAALRGFLRFSPDSQAVKKWPLGLVLRAPHLGARAGQPRHAEPVGPDYTAAIERAEYVLLPAFDSWRSRGLTDMVRSGPFQRDAACDAKQCRHQNRQDPHQRHRRAHHARGTACRNHAGR